MTSVNGRERLQLESDIEEAEENFNVRTDDGTSLEHTVEVDARVLSRLIDAAKKVLA